MTAKKPVYPYIPNSAPDVKAEMLRAVGAKSIDEFYADIPANLRYPGCSFFPLSVNRFYYIPKGPVYTCHPFSPS